jgi:hypothetical protein
VSFPTPALTPIFDKFAADLKNAIEQARAQACRELADRLNQAVRRIRQAGTRAELGETVADTAARFAAGAAWFRIEEGVAFSDALGVKIPLAEAAALKEAAGTGEPVVALASPPQVSAQLTGRFAHAPESRAYIYPIGSLLAADQSAGESAAAVGKTSALLYAWADAPGQAQHFALELLGQVASAAWEALEPPAPAVAASAGLVTIAAAAAPANPWDALSAQDQQIHLRAQRYARVQVAEMRLRDSAAVQAGRARRSIYQALRDPIDTAREGFRRDFFAKCPNMVDYLHLELTHTLANDDADLLGKDYPGPMV